MCLVDQVMREALLRMTCAASNSRQASAMSSACWPRTFAANRREVSPPMRRRAPVRSAAPELIEPALD